jgi:hypothetical protein
MEEEERENCREKLKYVKRIVSNSSKRSRWIWNEIKKELKNVSIK